MCGMKLFIHFQTSTVAPLKFENGWVISPNGCNYLSMLGLKLNHVSNRGYRKVLAEIDYLFGFMPFGVWRIDGYMYNHVIFASNSITYHSPYNTGGEWTPLLTPWAQILTLDFCIDHSYEYYMFSKYWRGSSATNSLNAVAVENLNREFDVPEIISLINK